MDIELWQRPLDTVGTKCLCRILGYLWKDCVKPLATAWNWIKPGNTNSWCISTWGTSRTSPFVTLCHNSSLRCLQQLYISQFSNEIINVEINRPSVDNVFIDFVSHGRYNKTLGYTFELLFFKFILNIISVRYSFILKNSNIIILNTIFSIPGCVLSTILRTSGNQGKVNCDAFALWLSLTLVSKGHWVGDEHRSHAQL